MSKRRFTQYQPLMMFLKRNQIENPGSVATFLLTTFFTATQPKIIKAEQVRSKNLIKQYDDFRLWRQKLIDLQILNWEGNAVDNYRTSKFLPGIKLLEFLDREAKLQNDIESLREEVRQLRLMGLENQNEIQKIWDAIRDIERNDPPVTETKVILKLVESNSNDWD